MGGLSSKRRKSSSISQKSQKRDGSVSPVTSVTSSPFTEHKDEKQGKKKRSTKKKKEPKTPPKVKKTKSNKITTSPPKSPTKPEKQEKAPKPVTVQLEVEEGDTNRKSLLFEETEPNVWQEDGISLSSESSGEHGLPSYVRASLRHRKDRKNRSSRKKKSRAAKSTGKKGVAPQQPNGHVSKDEKSEEAAVDVAMNVHTDNVGAEVSDKEGLAKHNHEDLEQDHPVHSEVLNETHVQRVDEACQPVLADSELSTEHSQVHDATRIPDGYVQVQDNPSIGQESVKAFKDKHQIETITRPLSQEDNKIDKSESQVDHGQHEEHHSDQTITSHSSFDHTINNSESHENHNEEHHTDQTKSSHELPEENREHHVESDHHEEHHPDQTILHELSHDTTIEKSENPTDHEHHEEQNTDQTQIWHESSDMNIAMSPPDVHVHSTEEHDHHDQIQTSHKEDPLLEHVIAENIHVSSEHGHDLDTDEASHTVNHETGEDVSHDIHITAHVDAVTPDDIFHNSSHEDKHKSDDVSQDVIVVDAHGHHDVNENVEISSEKHVDRSQHHVSEHHDVHGAEEHDKDIMDDDHSIHLVQSHDEVEVRHAILDNGHQEREQHDENQDHHLSSVVQAHHDDPDSDADNDHNMASADLVHHEYDGRADTIVDHHRTSADLVHHEHDSDAEKKDEHHSRSEDQVIIISNNIEEDHHVNTYHDGSDHSEHDTGSHITVEVESDTGHGMGSSVDHQFDQIQQHNKIEADDHHFAHHREAEVDDHHSDKGDSDAEHHIQQTDHHSNEDIDHLREADSESSDEDIVIEHHNSIDVHSHIGAVSNIADVDVAVEHSDSRYSINEEQMQDAESIRGYAHDMSEEICGDAMVTVMSENHDHGSHDQQEEHEDFSDVHNTNDSTVHIDVEPIIHEKKPPISPRKVQDRNRFSYANDNIIIIEKDDSNDDHEIHSNNNNDDVKVNSPEKHHQEVSEVTNKEIHTTAADEHVVEVRPKHRYSAANDNIIIIENTESNIGHNNNDPSLTYDKVVVVEANIKTEKDHPVSPTKPKVAPRYSMSNDNIIIIERGDEDSSKSSSQTHNKSEVQKEVNNHHASSEYGIDLRSNGMDDSGICNEDYAQVLEDNADMRWAKDELNDLMEQESVYL